jgi:predicted DNA-binding protein
MARNEDFMQITINIPENISTRFDFFASQDGVKKEQYIEEALLEKLQDLEDLAEVKAIYLSKNSTYKNLEDLEKEFGLAD